MLRTLQFQRVTIYFTLLKRKRERCELKPVLHISEPFDDLRTGYYQGCLGPGFFLFGKVSEQVSPTKCSELHLENSE
ncbi:hypothetical protein TNIN_174131 [Trichonephila inaurata madagascariensis]|uniref:Uncharacterized protein n=1 Tax=Trichonephila inaurata madagascariensis TaxID=2747483 RepID=A0A8X7BRK2_9ARAC|nr:hypothetical protein TNIN_174131 [Trichonephila inaurata madagascariensis]